MDYAGQTIDIIDRHGGEIQPAQIFVAVLGCSKYIPPTLGKRHTEIAEFGTRVEEEFRERKL